MRVLRAIFAILFFITALFASDADKIATSDAAKSIKIATYNTQNLFDGITQGTEYPKYRAPKWSAARYQKKLAQVAAAIKKMQADIIALQEIENAAVLADLARQTGYKYYEFATTKGAPVGLGIMSRLPIKSAKKYLVSGVKTRPILVATINFSNKDINFLVAHLPSFKNSDDWRQMAAKELIKQAKRAGEHAVILGDLNSHYGGDFLLNPLRPSFVNLWSQTVGKKQSYKKGGTLDHIMLSNALFTAPSNTTASTAESNSGGTLGGKSGEGPKYKKGSFRVELAGGEASDHYGLSMVLEGR